MEIAPTGSDVVETAPTGSDVVETAPTGSDVVETAPTGSDVVVEKRLSDQEYFYGAVLFGHRDNVLHYLVAGKVDVNYAQYYSPLQEAAVSGYVEIVQMILEHGGDVTYVGRSGHTALHSALQPKANHKRYEIIVRALLLHGSDVNKRGRDGCTPIQYAVLWGSSKMVQILLEHGANIAKTDDSGQNALHSLAYRMPRSVGVQNKICKMLINHGSNVRFNLRVLQAYDYGDFNSDASDSEDEEIPQFTPVELADLVGKTHIAAMMKEKERSCIQQIKQLTMAKNAKIEARRVLVKTAFAMGQHARLGENSQIMGLGPDMLQMILKHV
jgi:uncharacterized protein